jgi:flagellin-specific chaperone FliS
MSGIETCNELEETVKKLTDIIHELNSTLKVANDLGLYPYRQSRERCR